MKVLAIETSCDETAIAVLRASGDTSATTFHILGSIVSSQFETHRPYGGVFPALAKREHAHNLVSVLKEALEKSGMQTPGTHTLPQEKIDAITAVLEREEGLAESFLSFVSTVTRPEIDLIAVTRGPGLVPALWVGVNFAKALSLAWDIPLVGVNHMEGHLLCALAERQSETELRIDSVPLPVLALLISGGHTELVLMNKWLSYSLVGRTKDDAVGEAYDKVARMLDLPYPGGPEISKLAEDARQQGLTSELSLPRPMIDGAHFDFSFSGLKTAVLYLLKGAPETDKATIAHEFENAVGEVLSKKTLRALNETGARTLAIGGGVSANTHIRRVFTKRLQEERPDVSLRIPHVSLTGDNAVMIAIAGYYRALQREFVPVDSLAADGNLSLT